jgi:hypothetical protein
MKNSSYKTALKLALRQIELLWEEQLILETKSTPHAWTEVIFYLE